MRVPLASIWGTEAQLKRWQIHIHVQCTPHVMMSTLRTNSSSEIKVVHRGCVRPFQRTRSRTTVLRVGQQVDLIRSIHLKKTEFLLRLQNIRGSHWIR